MLQWVCANLTAQVDLRGNAGHHLPLWSQAIQGGTHQQAETSYANKTMIHFLIIIWEMLVSCFNSDTGQQALNGEEIPFLFTK